jgi:hypothetical protein
VCQRAKYFFSRSLTAISNVIAGRRPAEPGITEGCGRSTTGFSNDRLGQSSPYFSLMFRPVVEGAARYQTIVSTADAQVEGINDTDASVI